MPAPPIDELVARVQQGLASTSLATRSPLNGTVSPETMMIGPWRTEQPHASPATAQAGARRGVELAASAPFSLIQRGTTQAFSQQGQVDLYANVFQFDTSAQVLLDFSEPTGLPMWLSRASEFLVYQTVLSVSSAMRIAFSAPASYPVLSLTYGGWHNTDFVAAGTTF